MEGAYEVILAGKKSLDLCSLKNRIKNIYKCMSTIYSLFTNAFKEYDSVGETSNDIIRI